MNTNPSIEALINKNTLVSVNKVEHRIITGEDGITRNETAIIDTYYKDTRKFIKTFPDGIDKFLQVFEGNTRAQTPFIIYHLLLNSMNKNLITLSHKVINDICAEKGIVPWSRSQASKNIKWLQDNDIIYKTNEKNKYNVNIEIIQNGKLSKQLGLDK